MKKGRFPNSENVLFKLMIVEAIRLLLNENAACVVVTPTLCLLIGFEEIA